MLLEPPKIMYQLLVLSLSLILAACTYGPEQTVVRFENALAKPESHQFALALDYSKIKAPTGISTFPDGGVPKIIEREARVYLCDLDKSEFKIVAKIPNYAGIPQAKSVWIMGWQDQDLYFSLSGYGGNQYTGDDFSDPRRLNYRVSKSGQVEQVKELPGLLDSQQNTGTTPQVPFLRISNDYSSLEVAVDKEFSQANIKAKILANPSNGELELVLLH